MTPTVITPGTRVITLGNPGLSIFSGSSGGAAATYQSKVLGYSPIAYWPLNDAAGTQATELVNGWHGVSSNVTWGVTGIGDGETAASFNGTNSQINLFSASLAAAFGVNEGTLMYWVNPTSDANRRRPFRATTDNSEVWFSYKDAGGTDMGLWRIASGTSGYTHAETPGTWFPMFITWSNTVNQVYVIINATTQGPAAAGSASGALNMIVLGTFAPGNFTNPWLGNIANCAVWNSALSAATIADLAAL